jgi:N-acetylglucosaminyldiphosphoundecaprenol N-acetyl-beta-D-mannosaminyltransferase
MALIQLCPSLGGCWLVPDASPAYDRMDRGGNGTRPVEFRFTDCRIALNMPTERALMDEVTQRLQASQGFALATINLDHLVKLTASPGFRKAYAGQDLVVADGRPIVMLSRLAGQPVELMPGSDLVVPLCRLAVTTGVRVALVGSRDAALRDASTALTAEVPGLDIALCIAPSGAFDPASNEAEEVLKQLADAKIGLCFLALGAPKQEMLALRGRANAPGVGFASIGAGLDFIGGHQRRAPKIARSLRLEWLWRALSSPLRLGPRYVQCLLILPGQVVQALRLRGKSR